MAAPRSSWKGYLRVSLVSCPVRLYPASSSAEKISFNNLAPGSMSRISMVPTDPTTGKAVPREELLKEVWGYSADTFTRTVDVHVASLRQKVEADPKQPRFITTVQGLGYKFKPS